MNIKVAFGLALKSARKVKNLTQEDFGVVSSRTYVSTVERGMKSITIDKLEDFSNVLNVHPLTLLSLAYIQNDEVKLDELLNLINSELVLFCSKGM
jgi:transcriptional regulator with XRE-family HTH domain